MIRAVLLTLALSACVPAATAPVADGDVNDRRASAGLPPVTRSAAADRAAARHARDIAATGRFAHVGSDGSTHTQRLRAVGCGPGVENLAWGYDEIERVLDAWMISPGHRANLLHPDIRTYGLATEGDIWVMVLSTGC